jgi:hypothetical protein
VVSFIPDGSFLADVAVFFILLGRVAICLLSEDEVEGCVSSSSTERLLVNFDFSICQANCFN